MVYGVSWSIRQCLAVTVMTMALLSTTTAQPQQQQPAALPTIPTTAACPPPQATLLPCISYFTGNSSSPPTACCSQVQAMFESQAPCLCAAMASMPSQLGSGFAAVQALLPGACSLPPNACTGSSSSGSSSTPPTASGTTTVAVAPAPATTMTGPGDVDPTAAGRGGLKSVPGLLHSAAAAAASDYRGFSAAAAVLVSLSVAYVF